MTKPRTEWPVVEVPARMEPEELNAILFALGSCYGRVYDRIPNRIIAPALGLKSPRMLERWRRGDSQIPLVAAKMLRLFHAQSRVW